MNVCIEPTSLHGIINAIPSKSHAHRVLICSSFSKGETKIICPQISEDIMATVNCLNGIGASIKYTDGSFYVSPVNKIPSHAEINCHESGSTLRFILPFICALGIDAVITTEGRLSERPLSPMWEELCFNGAVLRRDNNKIFVNGKLENGNFTMKGNISSQFISGTLMALPVIMGDRIIRITGKVESAGYIDMTENVMKTFGVNVNKNKNEKSIEFTVPDKCSYVSDGNAEIEGDWSNAAFWLCGNALSKRKLSCVGLNSKSLQRDSEIMNIIKMLMSDDKDNITINGENIPDIVPIIAILAAGTKKIVKIVNIGRLRLKESDRIKSVYNLLSNLGGNIETENDCLTIKGKGRLYGGNVNSENDHRIAMSAAIASIICDNKVTIEGAEAVNKSYPTFWDDFKSVGGKIIRGTEEAK